MGVLKSRAFDIPIVCVGNITVGGTGKTPMCELLIEHFMQRGKVAILSRGYGRKSRGYHEVLTTDNHLCSGDEPLQMKQKYPDAVVVVCEKRVAGVEQIMAKHPDTKIIIMDDGFQHRYIEPKINIIMVDFTRPFFDDDPLPLGSLRDTTDELYRANYFVVTKCPDPISQLDKSLIIRGVEPNPQQHIVLTRIENLPPTSLLSKEISVQFESDQEVIALAGIGNPKPFIEMVERRYRLVDKMIYNDHYNYTNNDIQEIANRLQKRPNAVVLTTEKDSVKLQKMNELPDDIKERIYYTPIKMHFITGSQEELLSNIERDVNKN